jgi:threonine/homoserine/homoserine lactone efflux protein
MLFSSGLLIAFLIFAFVSSITPGPNNTMLLISGVNFGFRRSLPHILGVTIGFAILVAVASLGLGGLFIRWPVLYSVLRYTCAAYLMFLAWKILRSTQVHVKDEAKKPISFLQAAAFQWANPKAWVMSIIAVTTYVPPQHFFINIVFLISTLIVFVFFSGGVWTLFGNWIQRFLHRSYYLKIFNITMAVLLIFSLYPLFTHPL